MSLKSLADHLRGAATLGPVVLDERLLPSPLVRHLLKHLLSLEELVVHDAVISSTVGAVVLKGRADVLGVERAEVEVSLTSDDAQQTMTLHIRLPSGWTFAESLPAARGTPLAELVLTEAVLLLDTGAANETDLTSALSMAAGFGLNALLPGFGSLLGEVARIRLAGPISVARSERNVAEHGAVATEVEAPTSPDARISVDLSAALPLEGTFGPVSLRDARVSLQGPWIADPEPRPGFRRTISATVRVGGHDLALSGSWAPGSQHLNLRGAPQNLTLSSLSELGELVGADVSGDLPDGLLAQGALSLEHVEVEINTETHRVTRLGIGVRLPVVWEPIQGVVRTESVQAHWLVLNPTSDRKQLVSLLLDATVAGERLALRAMMPELILGGVLDRLPLATALRSVDGVFDGMPDLTLEDVGVSVAPRAGDLAFRATSRDRWSVEVGPTTFAVSDLQVDVQRTTDGDTHRVHGVIAGRVSMPFGTFRIEAALPGMPEIRGRIPSANFSALLQGIGGGQLVRSTPIPLRVNVSETVTPFEFTEQGDPDSPHGPLHVNMSETRTASGSTEQGVGRTYHVEDRNHSADAA